MNEAVIISSGISVSFVFFALGIWHSEHVDKQLQTRGFLWSSAGSTVQLVMDVLTGATLYAGVIAAVLAWTLWMWWNRGGGDGMRRRFRSWADSLGRKGAPHGA